MHRVAPSLRRRRAPKVAIVYFSSYRDVHNWQILLSIGLRNCLSLTEALIEKATGAFRLDVGLATGFGDASDMRPVDSIEHDDVSAFRR